MSDFDLVISGGNVATAADTFQCDIGILDGKIAALGTGLVGVAPLYIARKNNPGIFADNLTIMDMAQRPVLVPLGTQAIDSARRVGFMARLAVQTGVQETDIEQVWIGLRIPTGQVFRNFPFCKALPMNGYTNIFKQAGFRLAGGE